jgi:hypothetical protein
MNGLSSFSSLRIGIGISTRATRLRLGEGSAVAVAGELLVLLPNTVEDVILVLGGGCCIGEENLIGSRKG